MKSKLTHFDAGGNACMVDISQKTQTEREAVARGCIRVNREVFEEIQAGTAAKGDVLGAARIAGIMAAKKTSELIPLCHTLMLTKISVDFELAPDDFMVEAVCSVKTTGKTGAEMEALTGVSVALLTVYDMCKALDKGMEIVSVRLERKSGGKSGIYTRNETQGKKVNSKKR